jgi:hypothetical protein
VLLTVWFRENGATVVMVRSQDSADLLDYHSKRTKSDRRNSTVLATLPRLHPEGLQHRTNPFTKTFRTVDLATQNPWSQGARRSGDRRPWAQHGQDQRRATTWGCRRGVWRPAVLGCRNVEPVAVGPTHPFVAADPREPQTRRASATILVFSGVIQNRDPTAVDEFCRGQVMRSLGTWSRTTAFTAGPT